MQSFKNKLFGAFVLFFIWIVSHNFMPLLIPNPLITTKVFLSLFMKGVIPLHLLHSLYRILGGLLLAVLIGYPLGIIAGLSKNTNTLLSSIVYYLHPIPKIAFFAYFLWFYSVLATHQKLL